MLQVHVGVEVDSEGQALAWVREWFGCTAHGNSVDEAVKAVPGALWDFWEWLRRHGEVGLPDPGQTIEVADVESCKVGSNLKDADSEGFFSFDGEPLSAADIARARRYRSYARADALDLIDRLGADQLALPVGRSGRSVAATVAHLATADLWYGQRVAGRPQDKEWLATLLRGLGSVADAQLDDGLTPGEPGKPVDFRPDLWDGAGRPETWTPQKALRRFIWHDLVHLRAINRALNLSRTLH